MKKHGNTQITKVERWLDTQGVSDLVRTRQDMFKWGHESHLEPGYVCECFTYLFTRTLFSSFPRPTVPQVPPSRVQIVETSTPLSDGGCPRDHIGMCSSRSYPVQGLDTIVSVLIRSCPTSSIQWGVRRPTESFESWGPTLGLRKWERVRVSIGVKSLEF